MTGRMVVTGASGYLGRCLVARAAAAGWSVTGTYLSATGTPGERLDVRDREAVAALLRRVRPDVVVHTAAAREHWDVIADGAANVAVAAAALGVRLVHLSSDAVFSGRDASYDESATPDPVYPYGAAKAAAETAVRAVDPTAVLVRTSLILGDGYGASEVLTHDLVAGRRAGVLFTDEIRCPVHVRDLADAVLELSAGWYRGVLNVAGADAVSRYELGVLVARRDGLDESAVPAGLLAERRLSRPTEVRLRVDRAAGLLRTRLRGAREFLATR